MFDEKKTTFTQVEEVKFFVKNLVKLQKKNY